MNHTKKKNLGITVNRTTIEKILAVGQEFDLNKGGLYDARMGAVNFWCSPDDKPPCWDVEVTQGGLDYPRAYVGGLYWTWIENDAMLFIEIEAYDLIREKKKLSEDEWANIIEWVEQKVKGLLRLAELQADIVGTKCPFCDFISEKDKLLNDLLDHIAETHGEVKGVILGNPLQIEFNGKTYPLQPAETF